MVLSRIILDTKDKDSKSISTSDFFFSNNIDYQNVNQITIKSIQVPISWYNVRPGQQHIYVNNTQYEIPTATYNATTMLAALQLALIGYNITYSATTLKFTIAAGPTFPLNCSQWDKGMLTMLGFNGIDKTGAVTYTSDYMINMNPDTKLTLHSSLAGQINNTIIYSDGRSQMLLDIPIFSNLNSFQFYEPINPITYDFTNTINITKLDFQLKDKNNNTIDLNGLDVIISLEIE
jgi:hypothetical protein